MIGRLLVDISRAPIKLASLPRKNPVFRACQDFSRIVKTNDLLGNVRDPFFRRHQREGLNQGEERRSLSRRLQHGTDGAFRTGDDLAQLNSASGLNLLIALISVSTALEYQRLWQGQGGAERVPTSWLKTLSTFSTDGVIYPGKVLFVRDARVRRTRANGVRGPSKSNITICWNLGEALALPGTH